AYLLIEMRVYPGAVQGTIGLRVQNRFNNRKYRCTRTAVEKQVCSCDKDSGSRTVLRGRCAGLPRRGSAGFDCCPRSACGKTEPPSAHAVEAARKRMNLNDLLRF